MSAPPKATQAHLLLWLGGGLLALLPYFIDLGAPWVLGPGHFGTRWISAVKSFFLVATLTSCAWQLSRGMLTRSSLTKWLRQARPVNWLWFLLTLLIYLTHNYLLVSRLSFTGLELSSILLGRLLTAFVTTTLIWLAADLASRAAPAPFRLLPWVIPAIFPGLLILDALAIVIWQNPIIHVLNRFDSEGSFSLARQLKAGGVKQSPLLVSSAILASILVISFLSWWASRISKKLTLSPLLIIGSLFASYLFVAAEQGLGPTWKSRKALRMEQRSYRTRLLALETSPGVATYHVAWKEHSLTQNPSQKTTRPDIFFIMIESTRSDSITPQITPWLAQFRDEECQPLGSTWAASNGTHLSWYSIFNGQIPHRWGDAIAKVRKKQDIPLSPFLQTLKDDGYWLEVRAVSDLAYQGLGATNFGSPNRVDSLHHLGSNNSKPLPEVERANLQDIIASLAASSPSPRFRFLTYNSPHFPYLWGADFHPPFPDHEDRPSFGLYPSAAEITRVKNRYHNSLAWADQEIKTLTDALKAHGRYRDALIIITGDHGEEFQEQGSWFHCSSLETEQIAVPIFIKWPEGTQAPPQESASHLDLLPTLLDHLGKSAQGLPGKSLLRDNPDQSNIIMTAYCGITGLAMKWERGEYSASFRWYQPWEIALPGTIHLDDITGPSGSLDLRSPHEWDQALRTHFPDAPQRLFGEFKPTR